MIRSGSLAVAMVQRQVTIVQASRSHSRSEAWIEVYTFAPFCDRIFLPSACPQARISSSDILAVFPISSPNMTSASGMLELPPQAFSEFLELSARMQKKYEKIFSSWSARRR